MKEWRSETVAIPPIVDRSSAVKPSIWYRNETNPPPEGEKITNLVDPVGFQLAGTESERDLTLKNERFSHRKQFEVISWIPKPSSILLWIITLN